MNKVRQQLLDALSINASATRNHEITADLTLNEDFIGFQGHFPGQPVLPGVCMIAAVLAAVQRSTGQKLVIKNIKLAKFFSPVLPYDAVTMDITMNPVESATSIRAWLSIDDRKVAHISLSVAAPG